jgi:hypothetical protein
MWPPGELGQAFLLGDDDPPGDVGVENHAHIVRPPSGRQQ